MKNFKSDGFTLLELMVTVAITAILLTVGLSGMKTMNERGKLREQLSTIESSLKYARAEAVSRVTPVVVCATTDGLNCRVGGEELWDRGWFIFLDTDQDGAYTPGECADDEDCLLRYFPSITGAAAGSQGSLSVRALSDKMTFGSDGTITLEGGGTTSLVIRICMATSKTKAANDETESATLTVNPNGSIRAIRGAAVCP
jgi:type IV fimbrial biogenesis protein FimT